MQSTSPKKDSSDVRVGPHPSYIQVAKEYTFEHEIQARLAQIKVAEGKETQVRLQGVAWIDSVRKALQLPVRTYNTAVVYYHKFRLVHPDNEYDYRDAAAAALFSACKIEDTLKKSRDILCAAYNLKLPPADQLSPDDSMFDISSKTIVGLERLMLEASGFDFRSRHPQRLLIKFARACGLQKEPIGILAWRMLGDLYRTFAPLKQTSATMAHACLELAVRLSGLGMDTIKDNPILNYSKWSITREEIMETLLDLLDLYTLYKSTTSVGSEHPIDNFINIRIDLNQESKASSFQRYTAAKPTTDPVQSSNGTNKGTKGSSSNQLDREKKRASKSPPLSPSQPSAAVGERGRDGTVRFMLDAAKMKAEAAIVKEYFKIDEVEEQDRDDKEAERDGHSRDAVEHKRKRHDSRDRDRDRDRDFDSRSRREKDDDHYSRGRHHGRSEKRRDDDSPPRRGYDSSHGRREWDREKYQKDLFSSKRTKTSLTTSRGR